MMYFRMSTIPEKLMKLKKGKKKEPTTRQH